MSDWVSRSHLLAARHQLIVAKEMLLKNELDRCEHALTLAADQLYPEPECSLCGSNSCAVAQ